MLKTMKLLLAAAFLLAGLSLAGCKKRCEDEKITYVNPIADPNTDPNYDPNSGLPPPSVMLNTYVYLVDKKTGKPFIGDGAGQIPLHRVHIVGHRVHRDEVAYFSALQFFYSQRYGQGGGNGNAKATVNPSTGDILFGPLRIELSGGYVLFRFVENNYWYRAGSPIPSCTDSVVVACTEVPEIIDECHSRVLTKYTYMKANSSEKFAVRKSYPITGLTDTLRIEVER